MYSRPFSLEKARERGLFWLALHRLLEYETLRSESLLTAKSFCANDRHQSCDDQSLGCNVNVVYQVVRGNSKLSWDYHTDEFKNVDYVLN